MIYVVGDSHGRIFSGKPGFSVMCNHAWCAHNIINRPKMDVISTYLEKLKPGDRLILVFGEIDCRLHFHYQHVKQNVPISTLIDATVKRYGEVMKILTDRGIDFAIYNVVPANAVIDFASHYRGRYSSCHRDERKHIYREFHDRLNEFCNTNGYKIIDMWDVVATQDGFIKREFIADDVHINDLAFKFAESKIYKLFEMDGFKCSTNGG